MRNFPDRPLLRLLLPLLLLLALLLPPAPVAADPVTREEVARLRAVNETLKANIAEMEADLTASPALAAYEKEFYKALPDAAPRPLTEAQWAQALAAAKVVMLADDHATPLSQANTVKTLSLMARGARPLALVIEWIDRRHQATVDRYLAGDMPAVELGKRIEFAKTWGFSWPAYLKVLEAAKKLKVPVLLVERLYEKPTLGKRDAFITADIKAYRAKHPSARLLVVYGEYHTLGKGHLTDRLDTAGIPADMVIVGDAEGAFWSLLERTLDPDLIEQAHLSGRVHYRKFGTPLERRAAYRRYLMKLLGFSADDFETFATDREIRPIPVKARKFEALEARTAR